MVKLILAANIILLLLITNSISAQQSEEKFGFYPKICDMNTPAKVTEEECRKFGGQKAFVACWDCPPVCNMPIPKKVLSLSLNELNALHIVILKLVPIKFRDWRYPNCTIYLDYHEDTKNIELEYLRKGRSGSGLTSGICRIEGEFPENLHYSWFLNNGILTISRCQSTNSIYSDCCEIYFILSLDREGNLLVDGNSFNGEIYYNQPLKGVF